jgi:NADPH:quinone reductase-like Zn-dependent oxidoreductase
MLLIQRFFTYTTASNYSSILSKLTLITIAISNMSDESDTPIQALLLDAELKTASVEWIITPTPDRGEALIKVHAIALNPVDSLYASNPLGETGRVVGSDFSGTVHHALRGSHSKHGQRVAGFLQGACSRNDRPGAFAEYIACPVDLLWRVPDDMTLEQAAAISLCALTAAQAVFLRLGLEPPFALPSSVSSEVSTLDNTSDPLYFLIYGASTSVGLYAAQLVHQAASGSGRRIVLIGVASKARFPLLQAHPYSYDFLVDYHDAEWPSKVSQLTQSKGVDLAFDCISEGSTVANVSHKLHVDGKLAVVRSLEGGAWDSSSLTQGIEPKYGAVWQGLGERVEYQGFVLPASAAYKDFTVAFYGWLSSGGKLEANPIRLMPGGLAKVADDGFTLLGSGSMGDRTNERGEVWMKPISAEKMVYKIETWSW